MKKISNLLLGFSLLFFASQNSFAAKEKTLKPTKQTKTVARNGCVLSPSTFQSNVFQTNTGKVSVILLKTDQQPVVLTISNELQELIFSQKIKEDSVRQDFNLKELDPGQYTFTLTKNGECFTKTVTVK